MEWSRDFQRLNIEPKTAPECMLLHGKLPTLDQSLLCEYPVVVTFIMVLRSL